jgi:hypothetical protein
MKLRSTLCVVLFLGAQVATAETNQSRFCESLLESDCIESSSCKLELAAEIGGKYRCRDNRNACEEGFVQHHATQESCESKASCVFVQSRCYCAPLSLCRCGGGSPAICVPSSSPGSV